MFRFKTLFLTVLLVGPAVPAFSFPAGPEVVYDRLTWGAVVDTFTTVRSFERFNLRWEFVQAGSEQVFVGDRCLSRDEYDIDYRRGLVRVKSAVTTGATVRVSYQRLPILLKSIHSLRPLEYSAAAADSVPVRPPPAPAGPDQKPLTNLKFGGMESVSFSFGSNQGTSLDQSLKATIEGDITPTIQVKALLSDNNLPIQPEGNTEELEQLDEVFIELSSARGKATLGDLTLTNNQSKFSPFTRKLMGFSAEVDALDMRLAAAGASSKGVFRTVKFRGQEQLQGPYELLSPGRLLREVILAGTERVYLNGELLRRGKNLDYTIDYDNGTVMFTPARLITADSEIAVDFEVSLESYDRSTVMASVDRPNLPGGLRFSFLYARERDDPQRPKSASLGDAERQALAGAGDDPIQARTGGVLQVAAGQGSYVLVPADTVQGIPAFYEFNDSTGSYNLSFIETGVGQGDYQLSGFNSTGSPIYQFAGTGRGNYAVGKQLPLPESKSLLSGRLRRSEGRHLRFDLEFDVSDHDRNLFSSLDDQDNVGSAGEVTLQLRALPVRLGELGLSGVFSTINDRFQSLDKTRPSYYYRNWNLENTALAGREYIGEFKTEFKRAKAVALGYNLGRLERDDYQGQRHEGHGRLAREKDQVLAGRVFTTGLDGDGERRERDFGTVSLSYGLWQVVPAVSYTDERYHVDNQARADSGIAYDEIKIRLSKRRPRKLSFDLVYEQRDTEEIVDSLGGWQSSRQNRTVSGRISGSAGSSLRGELNLVHRREENFLSGGTTTADLARIKGFFKIGRLGLRSDVDYEISQNRTRILTKTVVFVGEGLGDYNAQGEPVGKGRGGYTLVYLPTTFTVPIHAVGLTWRFTWKQAPAAPGQSTTGLFGWIRRNVSLDQTFTVKEETGYDPAWKVYLLFPSALQRDGATLYGISSLRQDWSLLDGYKNVSLKFLYQRNDEEENRFEGIREYRFFSQRTVRLNRSLSQRYTVSSELSRELKQRGGRGIPEGTGSAYDVAGWSLLGGVGIRFSAGSTVDLEVEGKTEDDAVSGAGQTSLSVKPRLNWRISRLASLFARYEFASFDEQAGSGQKPIFFATGGNSHQWNVSPNIRLNRLITLVGTYSGRSTRTFTGKRIVDHDFKIETRAFF